jgi:transcriptional regulator with XRE-family HTH domain
MDLGQIIKKLRRDADITQERLAELLSVSPQAVSRWETNTAMPDVSLLPPLANLFNVTTDYLLGVDITKKSKRIRELITKINKRECENTEDRYIVGLQMIRDGLKLYPNSWELKAQLATCLSCLLPDCEKHDEQYRIYADEMNAVCEDVIANCPEQSYRLNAISTLCIEAKRTNNVKRAKEFVKTLPIMFYSRESMQNYILEGSELDSQTKDYLNTLMIHVTSAIERLSRGKSPDVILTLYNKAATLEKILYDDDDYVKSQIFGDGQRQWVHNFAEAGDYDNAFACLKKDIELYNYGPEHGFKDFSNLIPELILWDFNTNWTFEVIRDDFCFNAKKTIAYLEKEFPDSFKADPRFAEIKAEFEAFIEKYSAK